MESFNLTYSIAYLILLTIKEYYYRDYSLISFYIKKDVKKCFPNFLCRFS